MTGLFLFLWLQNASSCGGDAPRHLATAVRLGEAFDLAGAADAYAAAAAGGCAPAQIVATYLRGLIAARHADVQFGSAASLQPVRQAIASLESHTAPDPVARIAHAVLRAAVPAAQHERAEMALFIEEMLRLETIQLEARQPGLPVVTAHEAAGQFWLQLHLWEEATRAFALAGERIGATPHVMLGLARAAAGRQDAATACEQYTRLVEWWGTRPGTPAEITEARAYVEQQQCVPTRPTPR